MQLHWALYSNLSNCMSDSLSPVPVSQHIYIYIPISKLSARPCCVLTPGAVLSYLGVGREAACPMFVPLIYYYSVWHVVHGCSMWCDYGNVSPYLLPSPLRRWALPTQVPGSVVALYGRSHRNASSVFTPSFHTRSHLLLKTACVVVTWPHMLGGWACDEESALPSLCSSVCMCLWPE